MVRIEIPNGTLPRHSHAIFFSYAKTTKQNKAYVHSRQTPFLDCRGQCLRMFTSGLLGWKTVMSRNSPNTPPESVEYCHVSSNIQHYWQVVNVFLQDRTGIEPTCSSLQTDREISILFYNSTIYLASSLPAFPSLASKHKSPPA